MYFYSFIFYHWSLPQVTQAEGNLNIYPEEYKYKSFVACSCWQKLKIVLEITSKCQQNTIIQKQHSHFIFFLPAYLHLCQTVPTDFTPSFYSLLIQSLSTANPHCFQPMQSALFCCFVQHTGMRRNRADQQRRIEGFAL